MEALPERSRHDLSERPVPARDVDRVNALLRANLTFDVDDGSRTGPDRRRCRLPVTGTLVVEFRDGRRLVATHPVSTTACRRRRLHSLAGALAECAMTLGLGAAIYRHSA